MAREQNSSIEEITKIEGRKRMYITEFHLAVAFSLVACLLLSGTIVFRKAHGMVVHSSMQYLRTASWLLLGSSVALAFI